MWVVSVDGHDKLCGYQNWTFPLGVYVFIDTFSRKILSLKALPSNSDPLVIEKIYFDLLYELKMMPVFLRMDKGKETGKMASIHCYLMSEVAEDVFDDPMDCIAFGPSTPNKIERWWRDLHERLEMFFNEQLKELLDANEYDPFKESDRKLLAYVYIPIVQWECDIFVSMWSNHRIREQTKLALPTGIPYHMFSFPDKYGGIEMGIPLPTDKLEEVAEVSGVLEPIVDDMDPNLRNICQQNLPNPENIESKDAKNGYLLLKNVITDLQSQI